MTTTKTAKKTTTRKTSAKAAKTIKTPSMDSPCVEEWKEPIVTFAETVKIVAASKKDTVRTMKTDGFTDEEDWHEWLEQGESLLALALAIEEDIKISDYRPGQRIICERTEEAKRLVEEAVSSLKEAANVLFSGVSYESRKKLSPLLAVICQIRDRDAAQMMAKLSPDEVFEVFNRRAYRNPNRSDLASFILNRTLMRMQKAYLPVDESFII